MTDKATDAAIGFAIVPRNAQEQLQYATLISKSMFATGAFKNNPSNVMVACHLGQRLGMDPIQSMQGICVINGKPSLYGDALMAVCRGAGPSVWDGISERIDIIDGVETAICVVKRTGEEPTTGRFSMDDAKAAKLDKRDVWVLYRKRMLQMRARAFALRDAFADILMGFASAEEQQDIIRSSGPVTATVVDVAPVEEDKEKVTEEVVVDRLVDIVRALNEATDMEALQAVAQRIKVVQDVSPEGMAELRTAYKDKRDELQGKKNHVDRGKEARGSIISHIKTPTTPVAQPADEDFGYGYEDTETATDV